MTTRAHFNPTPWIALAMIAVSVGFLAASLWAWEFPINNFSGQ